MTRALAIGLALAIAAAGCAGKGEPKKTLLVYCASSMRQPMEALAKAYQAKTGVRVDLSFGDSGTLLIQAQERAEGDGFVVHDPFSAMAEGKCLVVATRALAALTPAIAVKSGTPAAESVKGLADLAQKGLKIGVPDPEKATAGNVLAAMLKKAGLTESVMKNAVLVSRASGDLVTALGLGKVDAIVAWDALIRRDASLKLIPIEDNYQVDAVTSATGKVYAVARVSVTMSVLKSSKDVDAITKFLDFAAGPEGRAEFEAFGFSPAQ